MSPMWWPHFILYIWITADFLLIESDRCVGKQWHRHDFWKEGSKNKNDIAKWEGKIGKYSNLSKRFTTLYLTIRNNEYYLNWFKIQIEHNMKDYLFQSHWERIGLSLLPLYRTLGMYTYKYNVWYIDVLFTITSCGRQSK